MRRRAVGIVGVVLVFVMAFAGVATLALGGDGTSGQGNTPTTAPLAPITSTLTADVVAEGAPVLPVDSPPRSYRIEYHVETAALGGGNARVEEITVRRPFDARLIAYFTGGTRTDPAIDVRTNLGTYADVTIPDDPDVGQGMPAAALGDLRFDGSLGDLVATGVFVPRERRELLGRQCQVYRTGRMVEIPPLAPWDSGGPSAGTYADVCIDAAGLVLEEVAIVDGTAQSYQIATAVEIEPAIDEAELAIDGEPLPFDAGGNELRPIDASVQPAEGYWVPSTPPLGAEHVGRFLLRTPQPGATGATSTTLGPSDPVGASVDTYVDVYAVDDTFVVVNQGPIDAATSRDSTIGVDVDAGALGPARVLLGATGSTLVSSTDTWFVEITAPLSSEQLAQIGATFINA